MTLWLSPAIVQVPPLSFAVPCLRVESRPTILLLAKVRARTGAGSRVVECEERRSWLVPRLGGTDGRHRTGLGKEQLRAVGRLRPCRSVPAGADYRNIERREHDTSYGHSLALLEDGSLWGWGENDFGQVGNGTVSPRETKPVRVSGL